MTYQQARPQRFQRLLYCDVESKWKNYHITTFPGQSLPKTGLIVSLEEAMDLSRDRQIEEDVVKLTTHLKLVPRSRKRGSIHPLPRTSSWRSA
jgi:hypothetical protein